MYEDIDDEMIYCVNCRNPLLYVFRETRKKYRKLPMKSENLYAIETIHTFICPKCGYKVAEAWNEEKIEMREKIDLKCAICGKTFKDTPIEGWVSICNECKKKYAYRKE